MALIASAAPVAVGRRARQFGLRRYSWSCGGSAKGWHYGDAVAPPGISREPILNEIQVHNLEHGEIMVQYDCPQECPEIVSKLEAIVRSYPKKVILAPYPGIFEASQKRIALTAWTKLVYLDDVDEAFIRKFIRNNKDKAPEFFPD